MFPPVRPLLFFRLLVIGTLATGCASMSGQGSYQTVLVRSEPPGASIFVDGKRVGQTPELIQLRRSRNPNIELETEILRYKFELKTQYRWSKSFARNFVFLTYAPLGWGIDLLSGTAWEIEDSPAFPVVLSARDAAQAKENASSRSTSTVVAIAPPQAETQGLSDAGGRALEKLLRDENQKEKSSREIRPYEKTLPIFIESDYELASGEVSAKNRLYRELKSDLIYESYIERSGAGWLLQSKARSTKSNQVSMGPTIELGNDDEGSRLFGYGVGLTPWWARILPNTVGVDFISESVNVELAGRSYNLEPTRSGEWWALGLEYLSAINISSTPDWRRSFGSRWEFSAVPSFRVSRKDVKAKNLPPPTTGQFIEADPEFRRWSLGAGYGFELGYLLRRHYFYFDLIPVFNWSQVSWRQNSKTVAATRTAITGQVELGYTYVFDSNWLLRLFTRTQGENIEVWQDAFSARLGDSYRPSNASGVASGLTLGYRFDGEGYQASERGREARPKSRP